MVIRKKRILYFSTVNPAFKYGGLLELPKDQINRLLPQNMIPKSILVDPGTTSEHLIEQMSKSGLSFPVIVKPNIGERGKNVEKVNSIADLERIRAINRESMLIQEFIEYPFEFGVLYFRIPDQKCGEIHSLTQKKFLTIKGDGKHTLEELLQKEVRVAHRMKYLKSKFSREFGKVVPKDTELLIEPIGNHNRGTIFVNANNLITDELVKVFDEIAKTIEGFFYGRFDVKVRSLDDLYAGKNIKILELNGVSSEPAHIYDPDYSLLKAYKDILFHVNAVFKISSINAKNGARYDRFTDFVKDYKLHRKRNKARRYENTATV